MSYIEVSNFSKSINNKFIIQDINFKLEQGEVLVILGKSGAGKSTIFSLLCKMYDVTDGTITIDGIDIKDLDKWINTINLLDSNDKYNNKITVDEDSILFNGNEKKYTIILVIIFMLSLQHIGGLSLHL